MNFDSAYIIQDLRKFFSEYLNINLNDIRDDSLIIEELGADSLALVDLSVHIEDTYEITLDTSYILQSSLSVKDIANKIFFELNNK